MSNPIWVDADLLTDAALFTGLAVAMALVSLLAPAERRRGLVMLAGIAIVLLAGLAALGRFGVPLGSGTAYDIAREALIALLAVVVIRAVALFLARVVFVRFRVPHILVDVVFVLGMLAYAIYRLNATGVNLAGIVTTSAIVTGALAFSAGDTLGNLWAGLSLQLENTLRLGDWVRIDDRVGQVVSIRWRSMAIATAANETIVIPNSMLMKDRVMVLGRSGAVHAPLRRSVTFRVDYGASPAKVIRVIADALCRAEIPNVARHPAAGCVCKEFDDSGVLYRAIYYPIDIGSMMESDSAVLLCVFAALEREGLPIPLPQQVVEIKRRSQELASAGRAARAEVLAQSELFDVLVDEERASLAATLHRLPYASGEPVFRKGESADSLYILASGTVHIMDEDAAGRPVRLAELAAPAYFGEMGLLTGQPRRATVIAAGEVLCYRLGKPAFDAVLQSRPEIAEELAHVLARRQAENDATLELLHGEARAPHAGGGALEMLRRIRQFFALPSAER